MLFYVSIADEHSGAFVGGVYLHAEDWNAAVKSAGALAADSDRSLCGCFEMRGCLVPAGGAAIPAIGRLLSYEDMERAGLVPVEVETP